MEYFLIGLFIVALASCITNNTYTQEGKGNHKVFTADDFNVDEFNKDSEKKVHEHKSIETTGIKQGLEINLDATKNINE